MHKYKYEILLFILDAIYMILEITASRILSPYFGSSNIVWTSIIGTIILSTSLGNYIGGKLASKYDNDKLLKNIVILIAIFILIISLIYNNVLLFITNIISIIYIASLISSIILFFIPSLLLGMILPIILNIKLTSKNKGIISGKITAIGNLGSIFGTFIGGFILIPFLGSNYILYLLSIILLIISIFIKFNIKDKYYIIILILLMINIIFISKSIYYNNLDKNNNENNTNINLKVDSEYGTIEISNMLDKNNELIRILKVNNTIESAMYLDKNKKYDLAIEYTKYYDLMFESKIDIKKVLMIGGGAFSYPKYYLNKYEDKKIDVIEIDNKIIYLAKKHFYLEEVIKNNKKRINIINEDGRVYINKSKNKYDAILNDSFTGDIPTQNLTTIEAITNIHNMLNEGGIYLTNIISSLSEDNSKFLYAEVNTINKVFKYVYVIPCNYQNDYEIKQNNMVIASDNSIYFDNAYNILIKDNEIVLTDNYYPIEYIVK